VDEELKTYLEGKFSYLDGKFSEVSAQFSEVRAEIEAVETRLLSEFWKRGQSSDQRIRRVEHSDATTMERLAAMEERIFTLERKWRDRRNKQHVLQASPNRAS